MRFDDEHTLKVAFASLRHLAQGGAELLVVVEDDTTAALVRAAVPPIRALFVSNLAQLGCSHLPQSQRRHSAALVIEILSYAEHELSSIAHRDKCALVAAKLRGLVDRDICPTYSPRQARSGTKPPTKHAHALSACTLLRCTPLNDIESTFFVAHIASLMEAVSLLGCAREELGLDASASSDEAVSSMVQEWLLPLYCVRSFFARQSPAISARGLSMLVGTWSLPKLIASTPAERAVQIAKSVLPVGRLLTQSMEAELVAEVDAALHAEPLWPYLIHGHDLIRVLGMLHSFACQQASIPSSKFFALAEKPDSYTEGMRELASRERVFVDVARNKLSTSGNAHVAELIGGLLG
jgi:hypothetical protein